MVFDFLNIFKNAEWEKYALHDSIKTWINIIDEQHLWYFIFSKKLEDKINTWTLTNEEAIRYFDFIYKYLDLHFECEEYIMDLKIWNTNIAIKQEEEHIWFLKQMKVCLTKDNLDYNALLDHINNWFYIHITLSDKELWKQLMEVWFDERRYDFKESYLNLKNLAINL